MSAAAKLAASDTLPVWNLADLFPGPDSPELKAALEAAVADAQAFEKKYASKLDGLSGSELGAAIQTYEKLDERLSRLSSYSDLTYAGDQSDPAIAKFYQGIQERVNAAASHTLFFTLELNRLEESDLAPKLKEPALRHYAPWLSDLRSFRAHQLGDDMEKLLHEKYVAGKAAWTRLFDETMAGLRFDVDGKSLTSAEALHLLSDRSGAVRKTAAKAVGKTLGDNAR
ncbi:MAG: oligoendopeptidase F, partial [Rhodospirillales bacterium]